jgi:hypothetical protein
MYDTQQIMLKAEGDSDKILLVFGVKPDYIENAADYLNSGEKFSPNQRAQFRLKWCGDDNNCFTSENIDTRGKNLIL